jgi:hypothetical protein
MRLAAYHSHTALLSAIGWQHGSWQRKLKIKKIKLSTKKKTWRG